MDILIDTHTALWWINEHENLSKIAKTVLLDENNALYISIISSWEIAIKSSIGKLTDFDVGVGGFHKQLRFMPVKLLPIQQRHIEIVEKLPFLHKDPFDRMLIAQAATDNMTILTADENIHRYDILTIW